MDEAPEPEIDEEQIKRHAEVTALELQSGDNDGGKSALAYLLAIEMYQRNVVIGYMTINYPLELAMIASIMAWIIEANAMEQAGG